MAVLLRRAVRSSDGGGGRGAPFAGLVPGALGSGVQNAVLFSCQAPLRHRIRDWYPWTPSLVAECSAAAAAGAAAAAASNPLWVAKTRAQAAAADCSLAWLWPPAEQQRPGGGGGGARLLRRYSRGLGVSAAMAVPHAAIMLPLSVHLRDARGVSDAPAAALAAATASTALYPAQALRTRLQARGDHSGVCDTLRRMLQPGARTAAAWGAAPHIGRAALAWPLKAALAGALDRAAAGRGGEREGERE